MQFIRSDVPSGRIAGVIEILVDAHATGERVRSGEFLADSPKL